MRATITTLILALATVIAPLAAEAQQRSGAKPTGKSVRVGFLASGPAPGVPSLNEAFREGLRELGYVEGQNLTIEWRWAEHRYERLPELAADLVRLGVDAIFTPSDQAAVAAKQATRTIAIVFSGSADPVASQFVVSLSRPGGNMTGLTHTGTQLTGKRLSFLMEAVPKLSRIAILSNPLPFAHHLRVSLDSARALGLQSQVFEARRPQDFAGVFLEMVRNRAQGVLLLPDSTFFLAHVQLGELALQHRLPMIGWRPDFALAGSLMAYGASATADFRRAGALVGKILNGAKPSDLPVEEPEKVELVINLKTAKALGLTIPQSLLGRADQVIE
jgi:putative ABC transport system substrate-binding protein